jgi:hypothetical protein
MGFLPQEGFPGYTCFLFVIVSLLVILIYADVLVCWLYESYAGIWQLVVEVYC